MSNYRLRSRTVGTDPHEELYNIFNKYPRYISSSHIDDLQYLTDDQAQELADRLNRVIKGNRNIVDLLPETYYYYTRQHRKEIDPRFFERQDIEGKRQTEEKDDQEEDDQEEKEYNTNKHQLFQVLQSNLTSRRQKMYGSPSSTSYGYIPVVNLQQWQEQQRNLFEQDESEDEDEDQDEDDQYEDQSESEYQNRNEYS